MGESNDRIITARESTWINVAVFAVFMRNSIACRSSGRTGKTASPALRMRWMIRSPMNNPPDSSWLCKSRATKLRMLANPDWFVVGSVQVRTCWVSFRMMTVKQETPF